MRCFLSLQSRLGEQDGEVLLYSVGTNPTLLGRLKNKEDENAQPVGSCLNHRSGCEDWMPSTDPDSARWRIRSDLEEVKYV